ncbi:hypothetical protein [Marinagarivorans cellulosilyticus]|uniref:Uncharacterized protein n=1 Tax=Marinagarivorans cellulosilyticus TaxID=2721545 RepID=A0AAN2BM14_9GAMM|nr:hypothetical protein [Marinagarivorans cellulosilyticus]BCD99587.1 hypothetical protein MARGE09_P3789 [Marinagarivorans cellulosilyticus]
MSPITLTQAQEKDLLINTDRFHWETFAHKPLNVFDLGEWTLSFPGDTAQDRNSQPWRYANYQFDINDLATCPKYLDPNNIKELWNEESQEIMWLLGRDNWSCHVHADGFVLIKGSCMFGITVSRFQHIEGVTDLRKIDQLTQAVHSQLAKSNAELGFKPVLLSDCFTKNINSREWAIAKGRDGMNSPDYSVATALDYRTAITAGVSVGNSWFDDEEIPPEVEEKYLASFWDFLSHVTISATPPEGCSPGIIERTAPGQAIKTEPENTGW